MNWMETSTPAFYNLFIPKEIQMSMQPFTQQVRWQDLMVKSEVEIVLELAKKEGWVDCEIFGYGDMITQPQESKGWKLIPANLYKYSIPAEAVGRLHQIINTGVRIKGVVIADDERSKNPQLTPTKPKVSLSSVKTIAASIKTLTGKVISLIVSFVGKAISFIGKALLGLMLVASVIGLVSLFIHLIKYLGLFISLGLMVLAACMGSGVEYDPKLVILVDDDEGRTVWVSLFTWYN